jgi:hypothetical protein
MTKRLVSISCDRATPIGVLDAGNRHVQFDEELME